MQNGLAYYEPVFRTTEVNEERREAALVCSNVSNRVPERLNSVTNYWWC